MFVFIDAALGNIRQRKRSLGMFVFVSSWHKMVTLCSVWDEAMVVSRELPGGGHEAVLPQLSPGDDFDVAQLLGHGRRGRRHHYHKHPRHPEQAREYLIYSLKFCQPQ